MPSQETSARPARPLLRLALQHLAGATRPRVGVLAAVADPPLARRVAEARPDVRLTVVPGLADLDDVHLRLAAAGPFDLLLDPSRAPGARKRFETALLHLRPGGALLVRSPEAAAFTSYLDDLAAARAEDAEPPRAWGDPRPRPERDRAALAHSLAELERHGDVVRAVNRTAVLAKLPEATQDRFLALRPAAGRVLSTVPGVTWDSRAVVRASSPPPLNPLPATIAAPPLSLREYDDVVTVGRQVAFGDGFVLPESYRDPTRARLHSPPLTDWTPRFQLRPAEPARRLAGTFFHLDTHVPEHFGHAVTEQLGHVWGWAEARERHPDLRALLHLPRGRDLPAWTVELLEAAGVPRDRLLVVHEPVRVERLVATSAAYVIGGYAHPVLRSTYDAVGAALEARASGSDSPRRLFHTRRHGKRTCRNAAEVEAAFVAAGFTVVRPEEHPLAEQVRMVRHAEVVAGFAGSGMFHTALTGRPQHVVVLTTESYPAHNEHAFAALLGHRFDLVVSRPDVPRGEKFSAESFHSDYVVDPDREGRFLAEVLAALGP